MSEESGPKTKPYRVEVTVDAPRETVWRALTEPEELRRWFGWDYDGLEEEIRYIFVDHAIHEPPGRIGYDEGEAFIELEASGSRTIVRAVNPGPLDDAEWAEIYDEIEEGWRAFFHQLKHYLERRPGEERRSLFLAGDAAPAELLPALDARAPGREWHRSRHQRGTSLELYGGGLAIAKCSRPLDSSEPGRMNLILTTHGLDDAAFDELRRDWSAWWSERAEDVKVLP